VAPRLEREARSPPSQCPPVAQLDTDGDGNPVLVLDPATANIQQRFYRLMLVQP
jgi:hypothetical protein